MPHLVIFDVDGTLVDSLEAEAVLYPTACRKGLGVSHVSSSWDSYRNPTDRGIVEELTLRHLNRPATAEDFARVEACFLSLLLECHRRNKALYQQVPGAEAALMTVQALPNTVVAIATAGWRATALFKLECAGISVDDVPIASANDGTTKRDIMNVSCERALRRGGVPRFATVTYIGDSDTDQRAAADLGFEFIGVDTSGWLSDARRSVKDYADQRGFLKALSDAQRAFNSSE